MRRYGGYNLVLANVATVAYSLVMTHERMKGDKSEVVDITDQLRDATEIEAAPIKGLEIGSRNPDTEQDRLRRRFERSKRT